MKIFRLILLSLHRFQSEQKQNQPVFKSSDKFTGFLSLFSRPSIGFKLLR